MSNEQHEPPAKNAESRTHTHTQAADRTHAQAQSHTQADDFAHAQATCDVHVRIEDHTRACEEKHEQSTCPARDLAQRKSQLRDQLKAKRAALSLAERARIDARIADHVQALDAWRSASVVCAYASFGSEVDTRHLIMCALEQGKRVALPRCVSSTRLMEWHLVCSLDNLTRSPLGVEEPACDPATRIDPAILDPSTALALVPGLTFDAQGFRLGYGGGFYDTFLATFPGTSIGLCRAAHASKSLRELNALEPHDLPVHIVITENTPCF